MADRLTEGARAFGAFLERNKVTQLAASKQLGVSDPTVNAWLSGFKRPKAHHRRAIAIWTRGDVNEHAWDLDEERAAFEHVRPFEPRTAADDSGAHKAMPVAAKSSPTGPRGTTKMLAAKKLPSPSEPPPPRTGTDP